MKNELVPVSSSSGLVARQRGITVVDVINAWLEGRNANTVKAYVRDMNDFANDFAKVRSPSKPDRVAAAAALLANGRGLGTKIAMEYLASMNQRGLASATISRRYSAIRSLVATAFELGFVDWSITKKGPKVEKYRDTRGPGVDGFAKLIAAARASGTVAGKRDVALMRLMYDLLLRVGECISLDLEHVELDVDKPCVRIIGKGYTDRQPITLSTSAAQSLRDWIAIRGDAAGPLFMRTDPGRIPGRIDRLTIHSVEMMIARRSRKAGLAREARPHGLRHAGITRLLDLTNGNVRAVAKASRHVKVETLLKYDDARADVAGELAELLGADG
jgi:integrase/recombinase XerC